MKNQINHRSIFEYVINSNIAKLKTSFGVVCLLALVVATGLVAGRFTLSTQAKSAASVPAIVSLTPEQMEAAIEKYFADAMSLDAQRYASNFTEDGVLEDPVGTPPVQGRQAIAASFGNLTALVSQGKAKVQEVIPGGQEAIVNWKVNVVTVTGKKITIDGMGVFKFDQTGKLQSVREFWDLAAFLAQL